MAVEEVRLSGGAAALGLLDQRDEEAVHLFALAVVGVQSNKHVIFLGKQMHMVGEGDRADNAVVYSASGGVRGAAGGNLDDTVGARLGKALEHRVSGFNVGDVERGIRISALGGSVQHFAILFVIYYRHDKNPFLTAHSRTIYCQILYTFSSFMSNNKA